MHGFHTRELDSFVCPDACARCAKGKPTQVWRLVHSTIEFPDGFTGNPADKRDYVDYVTQVPVCEPCYKALKGGSRLCWLLGAVGGAVAAFFTMAYMVPADIKLQGCIIASVAAAGVTTFLLGFLIKLIVDGGFGFAKLNGLEMTIKFANREYQKLFDNNNPAFHAPRRSSLGV